MSHCPHCQKKLSSQQTLRILSWQSHKFVGCGTTLKIAIGVKTFALTVFVFILSALTNNDESSMQWCFFMGCIATSVFLYVLLFDLIIAEERT
jgi:prepilin signal peptidase PulO-like enzyme (type II secretory pathway)